ncbi:porin family protein [Marnyiella aurantia]|uniref:Porin family protein n=1 Tax=Marnyiella aurantia TaxID=2758037 RepID=A0A7D7QF96_9FLAO|nr:outer membrane beta-barrel protein [Marnyiella aurantia]MBA5246003.1 porin family protein [Marnyiella aurantia]MBP0611692.1 porin family protein [Marnyiella aurantia]QMS98603.1 porin family protein [Marnyiella aurantia]
MKKVLLVGAVALFGAVNAQVETPVEGFVKGDTFITGAIGYTSAKQNNFEESTFTVAPSVGHFVSPNIAVGARVGYTNGTMEDTFATVVVSEEVDAITAGVFGRYYTTPASRFSLFGELNVNYANAKYTDNNGITAATETKYNGFNFGIAPGVNYFINKNFALEAAVGVLSYSTMKEDVAGAEAVDTFNFGLNFTDVTLGLVYKF